MSDNELYQEMILDHYKNPRNRHEIENASNEAEGQNPLCGDELKVQLILKDGIISDIAFSGMGCAISQASASMMTENLKGKKIDDALVVYEKVHNMLTGKDSGKKNIEDNIAIGKLKVLEGVAEFPTRIKCASLAWHTMKAALQEDNDVISTE